MARQNCVCLCCNWLYLCRYCYVLCEVVFPIDILFVGLVAVLTELILEMQ